MIEIVVLLLLLLGKLHINNDWVERQSLYGDSFMYE